jgi:autotransporter-associated beta strand protein
MKPEQITAWALDEASAEERQQLEAALLENPQDKEKADEMKAFCDFLLSELRDDSLALTDKQRERLVAQAAIGQSPGLPQASETLVLRPDGGTAALRPPSKGVTRWNIGVIVRLSLAACAVLGGFWTWQAYSEKQTEVHAVAAVAEKPGIKVQLATRPEAKKKPEARLLAAKPVKPVIVAEQPAAKPLAPMPKSEPVATVSALALKKDQTGMSRGDVEQLKRIQDQNAYGLSFGDRMKVPVTPLPSVLTLKTELAAASVGGDLNGGLVGSGKGVNTQMTKSEAAGAALGLVEGSGALVGASSSWVQEGTDTVSLNAGGVLTLAGTVSGSLSARLTMTPDATALMKQAQERPAASLSLKAGTRLYSSFGRELYFINGSSLSYASAGGTFAINQAPRVKVTSSKMGIVSGLLPGVQNVVDANGYPWMSTAPLELISAADEAEQHASLTDYQASLAFGDISLYNRGSASLVMNAANASTGSILVQSGAHLTLNAFLHQRRWAFNAFSTPSSMGDRYFKGISVGFPVYGWIPMPQELNTTSAGVISFATNANSQFKASLEMGSISAEDQNLLGVLFPRDQFLPGISAALADASGVNEMHAAVFNVTALSKSSSDASTVLGAGAVVMKDVAGNLSGKKLPLDLMSAPVVTTKAGTRATMAVTREFVYSGAIDLPIPPSSKLRGNSADAFANAPDAPADTGSLINNGNTAASPSAAMGTSSLSITSGATSVTKAEPPMALGNHVAIREYMATNGFVVGDTTAAASNHDVNGTNSLVVGTVVSGTPMSASNAATLDLNGAAGYTGDTTINGGVMTYSGYVGAAPAAPTQAGSVTLRGGNAAVPRVDETFAGIVSVPGGITKVGAGKLVVSSANTYTGATTISAGTLQASNGKALPGHENVPAQEAATQMNRTAGATFKNNGGGLVVTGSAAPVPAAPVGIVGGWATSEGEKLNAFNSTTPVGQNPEPDERYFSPDASSGMAMKDMKEEKRAFRKTDQTRGESYTRIIENELKDVEREPLSTLSIDVDTASYANVRRFLNQNMIPPPDAVRIEELVNYFPTAEEGPAHEAKEPFGVRVELAPCPWQPVHRLARIAIKGREMDKNRKASNLVFLVDVSGSMGEPAKLPLVQQSLRMLTEQLGEGDRVTMVVYAGSSGVVLPPTSGEKKEDILDAINRLSAGGSTHGSEGIKLAYEQAVAGFIKGGVNRVILCTDGDFNVGVSSPEELEKLIKHKAKSGVFLSVLGFGSGNLKDRTMETLADKGNGNYAYIDSLSEARKVLVEQMSGTMVTIAKDVKIQVEFNPAAVRSYRLIGYENRLLAKEDFNDDTKDAGEIGAGHSVVALYEIVPANLPAGAAGRPAVDSLKYQAPAITPTQLAEAAKSGEMMTVKLRYKEPESDLSKLIEVPTKDEGKTLTASSEEYKFSAAVAGFGLLLRDSSYKGTLSWETVRRLALDGKGADKLGYRGEFLQLIDKTRGLKETK